VEQTARDIDYRLGFMSEFILKQARWTVELALIDAVDSAQIDQALAALGQVMADMRILVDEFPSMIDGQRDSLFAALSAEREATLGSIDAQRLDTLLALSRERQAVFDGIDAQRVEILLLLRAEREAVVTDLEGVVERSLVRVVDHAIWRIVQVGLAASVLGLSLYWLSSRAKRA
jgi:hypothetical protein